MSSRNIQQLLKLENDLGVFEKVFDHDNLRGKRSSQYI